MSDAAQVAELQAAATAMDVPATQAALAAILSARSAADWESILEAAQVPCAAVRTPAQAWQQSVDADPRVDAKWPLVTLDAVDGRRVRVPGAGFVSSREVRGELRAPPLVGEHTDAVMTEAGVPPETIARLKSAGKVK